MKRRKKYLVFTVIFLLLCIIFLLGTTFLFGFSMSLILPREYLFFSPIFVIFGLIFSAIAGFCFFIYITLNKKTLDKILLETNL